MIRSLTVAAFTIFMAAQASAAPVVDPADPDWAVTTEAAVHQPTGLSCPLVQLGANLTLAETEFGIPASTAKCTYTTAVNASTVLRVEHPGTLPMSAIVDIWAQPVDDLKTNESLSKVCTSRLEKDWERREARLGVRPSQHDCRILASKNAVKVFVIADYEDKRIKVVLEVGDAQFNTLRSAPILARLFMTRAFEAIVANGGSSQ